MARFLRSWTLVFTLGAALAGAALAQPPATESGFLQVEPDVRIFYQRYGTGTPVLFIPNRHELHPTIAALLHFHDTVTWDPRGRGLSDRPDDLTRYGLDAELADAEALRRHFGAERVVYVGISLWGSVAMLYAARYPESVAGVVAMGPLAIRQAIWTDWEDEVAHDLTAELDELAAREADGRSLADRYGTCRLEWRVGFADSYVDLANMAALEAANLCQYRNEHFDRIIPVVFDGIIGSFGDWDWREEFASIQAPVLLLHGARGEALTGIRAYTDVLPNVGWMEFADAGHHVWNEHTRTVMGMIDTFVRGAWPAGVHRR